MQTPFQPGAVLNTQSFGNRAENIEVPFYSTTAGPTAKDILFPIGKFWLFIGNSLWYLLSQSSAGGVTVSNWIQIASVSGNILSITGTANQITATTTSGAAVLSIPATFIAPGSIASTTTITAGTSITATLGNITATNGNLVLSSAGNKLVIHATTPLSDSVGTTAVMSSGVIAVSTTACTTSSKIIYSRATLGGTAGEVAISSQTTGSFTLTSSSNTETSTFNYQIIN